MLMTDSIWAIIRARENVSFQTENSNSAIKTHGRSQNGNCWSHL